ncbi:MAG: hypothetical protein AB8G18_05195 [Gammaproteobacteria bacterium]
MKYWPALSLFMALPFVLITTSAPVYAHESGDESRPSVTRLALHTSLDEAAPYYEPVHYRSYRKRRYRRSYHHHGRDYYRYGHRHGYRSSCHRHRSQHRIYY